MNSTERNPAAGADMNLGIVKRHLIRKANLALALALHLLKQMVEYWIQERLILDGDCPIIAHSVPNHRHTRSSQQALATCFPLCVCACVCVCVRACVRACAYLVFLHMCLRASMHGLDVNMSVRMWCMCGCVGVCVCAYLCLGVCVCARMCA